MRKNLNLFTCSAVIAITFLASSNNALGLPPGCPFSDELRWPPSVGQLNDESRLLPPGGFSSIHNELGMLPPGGAGS